MYVKLLASPQGLRERIIFYRDLLDGGYGLQLANQKGQIYGFTIKEAKQLLDAVATIKDILATDENIEEAERKIASIMENVEDAIAAVYDLMDTLDTEEWLDDGKLVHVAHTEDGDVFAVSCEPLLGYEEAGVWLEGSFCEEE